MPFDSSVRPLRVAMFTPSRVQCGISDYSRYLIEALRCLPTDIANLQLLEAPEVPNEAARLRTARSIGGFLAEDRRYQALGVQMNADKAKHADTTDKEFKKATKKDDSTVAATDVAHVQHQYFFFGGVAPHKNHARAFLNAIQVPVALTVHEIALPPEGAGWAVRQGIALTNRNNFLHPAIRALIVHTHRDRKTLLALGAAEERIHVVTHGTPPAMPLPDPQTAKRTINLEGHRIVMLFGFLAAKKGHLLALEALKALPLDVVLLFAGGQHPHDHTDYTASLRARILRENLQARVLITGYLEETEIPTLMAATDVAIAPFLQSSGSGSLANLFAYGRAVVASDIAAHQEIATAMPEGLELFRAGDADGLAARITAVLNDATLRLNLQTTVLAYAERHSYLNMARQTTAIYRAITGF